MCLVCHGCLFMCAIPRVLFVGIDAIVRVGALVSLRTYALLFLV